jgi:hypothetical protein
MAHHDSSSLHTVPAMKQRATKTTHMWTKQHMAGGWHRQSFNHFISTKAKLQSFHFDQTSKLTNPAPASLN